jgi:hypothetical protein
MNRNSTFPVISKTLLLRKFYSVSMCFPEDGCIWKVYGMSVFNTLTALKTWIVALCSVAGGK